MNLKFTLALVAAAAAVIVNLIVVINTCQHCVDLHVLWEVGARPPTNRPTDQQTDRPIKNLLRAEIYAKNVSKPLAPFSHSVTPLLLPAAIAAGSSNGLTNTRRCRYNCLRS